MTRFAPCAALADRVLSIDVVEQRDDEVTVLPSAGAVLGLQASGRVRSGDELLSVAGVTGIQKTARRYGYVGSTVSVLVRFTPQGASCLGIPASELTNRSHSLDSLLSPARANELVERTLGAGTTSERVEVVQAFLLGLPLASDPLVERALELLDASSDGGGAHVAAVARRLSISERQLERRFLRQVGIGPKSYGSLRRFQRAIEAARTAPSLATAAYQAGYYDQSHFIRDFRRFAGHRPSELLRPRR